MVDVEKLISDLEQAVNEIASDLGASNSVVKASIDEFKKNLVKQHGGNLGDALSDLFARGADFPEQVTAVAMLVAKNCEKGFAEEAGKLGVNKKQFHNLLKASGYSYGGSLSLVSACSQVINQCAEAFSGKFQFCHFRAKTVDSNANGNFFISPEHKLRLPYIFSGSIQACGDPIPFDAVSCDLIKATKIANEGGESNAFIADAIRRSIANHPIGEMGTGVVDLRLRQVVLPRNGSYACLIPVGSGSIASVFFKDNERDYSFIPGTLINNDIGGKKILNVSYHQSVTKTLVFHGPSPVDESQRIAFAIYHSGYRVPKIPFDVMSEYAKYSNSGGEKFKSDRNTVKARELARINGLWKVGLFLVQDIRKAISACAEHKELLLETTGNDHLWFPDCLSEDIANGFVSYESSRAIAESATSHMLSMRSSDEKKLLPVSLEQRELIIDTLTDYIFSRIGVS